MTPRSTSGESNHVCSPPPTHGRCVEAEEVIEALAGRVQLDPTSFRNAFLTFLRTLCSKSIHNASSARSRSRTTLSGAHAPRPDREEYRQKEGESTNSEITVCWRTQSSKSSQKARSHLLWLYRPSIVGPAVTVRGYDISRN